MLTPVVQKEIEPPINAVKIPMVAGTRIKAELLTPVVWSQDSNVVGAEFLAETTSDQGEIKEGTIIALEVMEAPSSGFVQLKPVRMTFEGVDRDLPEGIVVTGKKGDALQAKLKRSGGGGAVAGYWSSAAHWR